MRRNEFNKMPINENKLKKFIENSGHPVSIKVSNTLIKNGWFIKNAPRYFDKGIKDYRELDIYAERDSSFIKGKDILLIECKKNHSHPWIFFTQNKLNKSVYTLNIAETTKGKIYDWIKNKNLFQKHYYYNKKLSSYSIVGLKNPDKKQSKEIYMATNQVITALYFYINQIIDFVESNKFILKVPFFYYPLIVFDGGLFEAKVEEDKIKIEEANHISFLVERELDEPTTLDLMQRDKILPLFSKQIIVDIIKLDYFDEFLKKNFDNEENKG